MQTCNASHGPASRGTTSDAMRAFAQTAVYSADPFTTIQRHGKRRQKRYLSLFTSLATTAVHLVIDFSMDTYSF